MKISLYLKKPQSIFISLLQHFGGWIPDKLYLKWLYHLKMGYKLDLEHPKTFSEKLQWLKLYDRKPVYVTMVDKYAVKDYVAKIIGEKYIIPTLGVWDKPEDVDWDKLPNQFVLKTTHGGGGCGIVICKNKADFDKNVAIQKLKSGFQQDIYTSFREWPYKEVPHRIIAEKYLCDESGYELKDYKVFNFNGEPKMIEIDYDRFNGHSRNLYTTDWELINATLKYPSDPKRVFEKPEVLEELLLLSRKVSKGIPHVRSDFFIINNKIYFGELTFYHGSGYEKTEPEIFNNIIGEWLKLPVK